MSGDVCDRNPSLGAGGSTGIKGSGRVRCCPSQVEAGGPDEREERFRMLRLPHLGPLGPVWRPFLKAGGQEFTAGPLAGNARELFIQAGSELLSAPRFSSAPLPARLEEPGYFLPFRLFLVNPSHISFSLFKSCSAAEISPR